MKKIIPVVVAAIYKNNTLLLTERKGKGEGEEQFGLVWHFPGGEVEFGEDLQSALQREIAEELNVSIHNIRQLPQVYSVFRHNWHGILIPHLCRIDDTNEIQLDEETYRYGWFTRDEIIRLKKLPLVQEISDTAFSAIQG